MSVPKRVTSALGMDSRSPTKTDLGSINSRLVIGGMEANEQLPLAREVLLEAKLDAITAALRAQKVFLWTIVLLFLLQMVVLAAGSATVWYRVRPAVNFLSLDAGGMLRGMFRPEAFGGL